MKRIVATVVAVVALLALPSVALAGGSSTCNSYNPALCGVVSSSAGGNGPGASTPDGTASTGSLPFTGLDIGLLAVGGVGLLGAGLVVRRLSAKR